jgi:isocitrate lyase
MAHTTRIKTYKRELAVALLVFWGYCVVTLSPETTTAITPWVFLYVLGAFGMDSYAKQVQEKRQETGFSEDEVG